MYKDLLIIGGGINGVGVAADAAGRGLSVTLCEMGDLASATSSASSRLIHGGLRYLENLDFKLVHESLIERSNLLHNAPHLVKLQAFVMPQYSGMRPYWLVRSGLLLYDFLAHDKNIPFSHTLTAQQIAHLELQPNCNKAIQYYDCTEDDSRLVVNVALLAKQHGAEILTHTKLVKAVRKTDSWLVTLQKHNDLISFHVKAIVNAAGPWVQQVANNILHITTEHNVKLVKGSHIIVPRLFTHQQAFILQAPDKRVIFLIPYLNDFTLIGTTEVVLDDIPQPVTVSEAEIDYLINITNQFILKPINRNAIINQYAGIRPLWDDKQAKIRKITRDYLLELNQQQAPVISIFGGKITTYRKLAETAVNKLQAYFPNCGQAWTRHAYLPGGNFLNADLEAFKNYLITVYPNLPPKLLIYYVNNYGTRSGDILGTVHSLADIGQHFGGLLYQREVDYLLEHEWATCSEDILWRRGKMGLWLTPEQVKNLDNYIAGYSS